MKIFIEPPFDLFENLEVGDMFEVNDKVYIKTEEIAKFVDLVDILYDMSDNNAESLYCYAYDEKLYNCFEFSSQKFYNVAGNTKVRKINSNNVEVHCN